jgi:hypothetical protein
VGQPGDLGGTAILVGLLCRSAVVLEGEFPAIGISPARLSLEWVRELDDALKREVHAKITSGAYEEACLLSELRTRSLYSSMSDVHRERRRMARIADPTHSGRVEQEARKLADEAVLTSRTSQRAHDWKSWRSRAWERLPRIAGAVAVVGVLALGLAHLVFGGDLDRLGGAELARLSPYLAQGARNGEGHGPAFVGRIDDDWSELPAEEQERAAARLVEAIRAQGVRQIMVYDGERRLRIQALGRQSVRVLPAAGDSR